MYTCMCVFIYILALDQTVERTLTLLKANDNK